MISNEKLPLVSEVVPTVSFSTQIFTYGMGSPEMLSLTTHLIWAERENEIKNKTKNLFIKIYYLKHCQAELVSASLFGF